MLVSGSNQVLDLQNTFLFIFLGEQLAIKDGVKMPSQGICTNCGYVSSNPICKACVLLEGLNKGRPKLAIGKSNKAQAELLAERLAKSLEFKNTESKF